MKAAVLTEFGVPRYADHGNPAPAHGLEVIDVAAATLNAVDIAIASGKHYLSPTSLPTVSGIEGAGTTSDGRRVYFSLPVSPYGSMAQQALVSTSSLIELRDGLDFSTAATLGNAGLAALMPLTHGGRMEAGENVVILGGTGVVGRLAVQAARLLGAGSITVVGRDEAALEATRELGATATVAVRDKGVDELGSAIRQASSGADVVLDYTWGTAASAALRAGNRLVRLVQIGDRAGSEITLPAQLLRSLGATIVGFMPLHYGPDATSQAYRTLTDWVAAGKITVEFESVPLAEVADAWERAPHTRHKLVLLP
ncbi:zinc-binding dehydrogenase [Rhodococcus sp. BS-15]|uniref:quinone oxidoreductase family protein n=1 Tax=Rhodococcus sp. BS-15 TaxID=1304954 RepID=UPI000A585B4E|nr:zinc-binding dehydrogenase [Rhodococcus sp. BS-15]